MDFPKIASLKTVEAFRSHVASLDIDLPIDEQVETGPAAPLAQPLEFEGRQIGNRFCILPMEGWDGEPDGSPTELTRRRWKNFGKSGAKLIWGGEAVAVRHDGRANPNQLLLNTSTAASIETLRLDLEQVHKKHGGTLDDLLVGLQLTHSGRFARPNEKNLPEPAIAYRHPLLDARLGINDDRSVLSDAQLRQLVDDFVQAARLAREIGFAFVDIKHCHGYLGHELLSSFDRPGRYGGSFENRTRFLREVVAGIRAEAPGLHLGIRVSVFDFVPFQRGKDETGEPAFAGQYDYAFGGDATGVGIDLSEPHQFMQLLSDLEIRLVCTSAGSPYYNPHILRPAAFPPSDGYLPPEDPLVGVARQIQVTAEIKRQHPDLIVVGSGYSYLQDWLPHVGQRILRQGDADSIGLGRMVLSYPELPADVLAGKHLQRKKVCRTFSDCTTAPRNGMVSGCYPLDTFYKDRPEAEQIRQLGRH